MASNLFGASRLLCGLASEGITKIAASKMLTNAAKAVFMTILLFVCHPKPAFAEQIALDAMHGSLLHYAILKSQIMNSFNAASKNGMAL